MAVSIPRFRVLSSANKISKKNGLRAMDLKEVNFGIFKTRWSTREKKKRRRGFCISIFPTALHTVALSLSGLNGYRRPFQQLHDTLLRLDSLLP
jgi:hypothetical protein